MFHYRYGDLSEGGENRSTLTRPRALGIIALSIVVFWVPAIWLLWYIGFFGLFAGPLHAINEYFKLSIDDSFVLAFIAFCLAGILLCRKWRPRPGPYDDLRDTL